MANQTTAGIQNLRGKIGIGTNAPLRKLHVVAASGETEALVVEGNDSLGKQLILGYNPTGNGYGTIQTVYQGTAFTNLAINASGGNVGIGTTSPAYTLTVQKSITDDWIGQISNTYNGAGNGLLIDAGDGSSGEILRLRDKDGSSKVSFLSNGNVGIGTTSPATKLNIDLGSGGTNGVAGLRIGATNNYPSLELGTYGAYGGMVRSYGNDLHYFSGHWRTIGNVASENHSHYWYTSKSGSSDWSAVKMELDHNGNLGIGTTSPSAKLDVAGAVQIGAASATPIVAYGLFGYSRIGLAISSGAT